MTTGQAALVAAGIMAPAALFAALGALASQLAPTRRSAQALAGGVLAVAVFLRIAADIGHGVGWLRWATPIGWVEQLRPVTGATPAVLGLFAVATAAVVAVTAVIARRRDIGSSVLRPRAVVPSRTTLLGSPTEAALRSELPSLLAWLVGRGSARLRARRLRAQRHHRDPQGVDPHLRPRTSPPPPAIWRPCSRSSR